MLTGCFNQTLKMILRKNKMPKMLVISAIHFNRFVWVYIIVSMPVYLSVCMRETEREIYRCIYKDLDRQTDKLRGKGREKGKRE
jgi:hypothetical protein